MAGFSLAYLTERLIIHHISQEKDGIELGEFLTRSYPGFTEVEVRDCLERLIEADKLRAMLRQHEGDIKIFLLGPKEEKPSQSESASE